MPTELTWMIALVLIVDGFLFGVGWILAGAVYSFILSVLGRGKAPPQ